MSRLLSALRITLSPPPGKGGTHEIVVGLGDPARYYCKTRGGQAWSDVTAGDVLDDAEGRERTVVAVKLFRSYGGREGDVIVSGRDWLRTGRVLAPADPGYEHQKPG